MKRQHFLDMAEQIICRDRQDIHGKPENTFELIAQYWSTYLSQETQSDVTLCAIDVATMMALFKVARLQVNPLHNDNTIDAIGYMAIAGELIDNTLAEELMSP